ncbi:unnamed protein product, partial [Mesorhabditis belari]|uniref:Period n=1 Tax=Mesorhabditis belari TaxID=2138241 RepID=A0AAF3EZK1_9BILA
MGHETSSSVPNVLPFSRQSPWIQSSSLLFSKKMQHLQRRKGDSLIVRDSCALASSVGIEGPGAAPTLSPPHTWTESSDESTVDEAPTGGRLPDDRLLFTTTVSIPDGTILNSRTFVDVYDSKDIEVGSCFLRLLLGTGQSFFLSAAATSVRQRVFSRVKCGSSSRACELQCEFEQGPEGTRRARVTALCLKSAFGPTSNPRTPSAFTTKHSLSCALTHIDYASVPFIGHLPTDVIGRSLLSFVYAPDVHVIRQAHIDLHNHRGKVVRSVAPIRLVVFNGALLTVDTEWSAYVSPWTRKIEMVVARHRVLDAPVGDADVMSPPAEGTPQHTLPLALIKTFEEELKAIMNRPVPSSRDRAAFLSSPLQTSPSTEISPPAVPQSFSQTAPIQSQSQSAMTTLYSMPGASYSLLGFPYHPNLMQTQYPDLSAYIDRLVESLVVHGSSETTTVAGLMSSTPQNKMPESSSSAPATPTVSTPMLGIAGSTDPLSLSYSQINCLENVHRLLKSQQTKDAGRPQPTVENLSSAQPSLPLTRAVLMEHTRRWEEQCKSTWKNRLAQKRTASNQDPSTDGPASKTPRTSSPQSVDRRSPRWTQPRPLPPNPSPPSGTPYQITSTPLPTPAPLAIDSRVSAFHQVHRRSSPSARSTPSTPTTGPSVIQPTGAHPSSHPRQFATPPPPQPPTECLLLSSD